MYTSYTIDTYQRSAILNGVRLAAFSSSTIIAIDFQMIFLDILCPTPKNGGEHSIPVDTEMYSHNAIGATYIYRCIEGYEPDSPAESICTSTGEWSIPPPNCTGQFA